MSLPRPFRGVRTGSRRDRPSVHHGNGRRMRKQSALGRRLGRRYSRGAAVGSPAHGQSLVEFALILPILLILVAGIIQYGTIFVTKQSLTQIGRDVGRWAATQGVPPGGTTCHDWVANNQPVIEANALARQASLLGYSDGMWNSSNFVGYPTYPDNQAPILPPSPPNTEGVEVVWSYPTGTCPPTDSTTQAFVTIRLSHRAPVFLPGFPYLPGLGTCDSSGCYFTISTTAEFRMEPHP
jgi:hypothetical protein